MNRLCILTVVAVLLAAMSAQGGPLPQPPDYTLSIPQEFYGAQANVDLLKGLLADKDETVRERAVANLGQTHNPSAIPLLAGALKDPQYVVRAAAVAAAGDFEASQVKDILAAGLKDSDSRVLFSAMRTVRQLQAAEQAPGVAALLGSSDALVRAVALETLTTLDAAAPIETLKTMLGDVSATIRLRAAQNVLCLKNAAGLVDTLRLRAESDSPAIRCAAIAALGKFDFGASGTKIAGYAFDKDPMARLGAVRAFELAKQDKEIRRFLEARQGQPAEASEMVRLAAIRAAGTLKSADCVGPLATLMLTAPMYEPAGLDSHVAARDSLAAIGNEDVAKAAAAALPGLISEYKEVNKVIETQAEALEAANKNPQSLTAQVRAAMLKENSINSAKRDLAARNIRACCRLLGATRSRLALDQQIDFLEFLTDNATDSPVLAELARSLGRIGDAKAAGPMAKLLSKLVGVAKRYLQTREMVPPPRVPYDEHVTAEVITAVTAFKVDTSFKDIQSLAMMGVGKLRLSQPTIAAAASYEYWIKGHRAEVEKSLTAMLSDRSIAPVVRYNLIKQAGRLKVKSAVKSIQDVLDNQRPNRAMILMAAWALQEITGKTPQLTQPKTSQNPNWVITGSNP